MDQGLLRYFAINLNPNIKDVPDFFFGVNLFEICNNDLVKAKVMDNEDWAENEGDVLEEEEEDVH